VRDRCKTIHGFRQHRFNDYGFDQYTSNFRKSKDYRMVNLFPAHDYSLRFFILSKYANSNAVVKRYGGAVNFRYVTPVSGYLLDRRFLSRPKPKGFGTAL
jgi:hypothetical protein